MPIFLFINQSFWNWHTICEIELRINFCYKFYLFFSCSSHFFRKKKTPFSHSTKNNRSLWVFILQIWFTYHNEAETIRKRSSALFFLNLIFFFMCLLIKEILKSVVFRQLFDLRTILQKKMPKMKNPEVRFYSLSFQLCFDMRVISVA